MSIASSQTSVTSSGVQIAASGHRRRITITNTTTTAVYIGATGVTTSTGHLLAGVVGQTLVLAGTQDAIFGIVASTAATVTVLEEF